MSPLFRFAGADIYTDFDGTRNVDVQINNNDDDVANSGSWHIDLCSQELLAPLAGGETLAHEWAHFDLSLDDEYGQDPDTLVGASIDPNTKMDDERKPEFCGFLSHIRRPQAEQLYGHTIVGEGCGFDQEPCLADANWEILRSEYQIPRYTQPYPTPLQQARYLDVLHELYRVINWGINP